MGRRKVLHLATLMLSMEQAICRISAHVEDSAPGDADELCSAFLALQEALQEALAEQTIWYDHNTTIQ